MPSLSHKRPHGQPYMLRVLSRAGQFAHLASSDIEEALDELYDHTFRSRIAGSPIEAYAEKAVPLAFVKAARGRLLTERAYDATTAWYVAKTLGVSCCLCLRVDYPGATLLDRRFGPFYCPTHLRTGNDSRKRDGSYVRPSCGGPLPFCCACAAALSNWVWRNHGLGIQNPVDDHTIFASAAWLVTNRTFRERVQENAYRASELRFDPRRIQTWGRRSLRGKTATCDECGGKRAYKAKTCRSCFRKGASAAATERWQRLRADQAPPIGGEDVQDCCDHRHRLCGA